MDQAQIKNEIAPLEHEAASALVAIQALEITTEAEADNVTAALTEVHEKIKQLETTRKRATKPLLDSKKEIDSWFRPAKTALEEAKELLKNKIAAWLDSQAQARDDALAEGDIEKALALKEPETPRGLSTREVWTWEVTDLDALPRSLLIVDDQKIRELVGSASQPEKLRVPGLRIFRERRVVMGRS